MFNSPKFQMNSAHISDTLVNLPNSGGIVPFSLLFSNPLDNDKHKQSNSTYEQQRINRDDMITQIILF